jgi:hypothetical protein
MAATRTLTGATLSNDGRSIVVVLNTAAVDVPAVPCVSLLAAATLDKVGAGAQCAIAGSTLTVALAPGATIMPGTDTIALLPSQSVLVDANDASARFTTPASPLALAMCTACKAPSAAIAGPKVHA